MLRNATSPPRQRSPRPSTASPASLTDRELEVIALVVEGCTNPEIATMLTISPRTVQSHVAASMRKLDARTRTHLAVVALRLEVVPLLPLDPRASAGLAA